MREGTLYGKMSSSDRRRSSKLDSKDESRIALENMHNSGKSDFSHHERDTRAEPLPGRIGSHRDDSIDEDRKRNLKEMTAWEEEESYGIRMSPGLDYWRQQRHNTSPKNEWKRSTRSRSQSRSRSRSPIRGFGRELGVSDGVRSRSGASAQVCKDYASGWCRRGNHCQFLHGQMNEDSSERQRKSMTPKYPMPHNSREYPTGSRKSTDYCSDFLKGNCRRGSSCRFAHHGASHVFTGKMSSSDEPTRGRNNDRWHRDASLERHNDRRAASDIPCKFFAAGNCRNGNYCRFSHQDLTFPSTDKSQDGRVSLDHHGYTKLATSSDPQNLREDKDAIIGATNQREADRFVDNKLGHCLEENKKLRDLSVDDHTVENKKNDSELGFVQRASEQWLGDMDMSPEWNHQVQVSKPIDKQAADVTNWTANITKQGTVAAVTIPAETNELYVKPPDLNLAEVGVSAVKSMSGTTAPSHGINLSNMISVHSFNQNNPSSNALPLTGLSAVGQGQIAFPNIRNPQIQMGIQEDKEISNPSIVEPIALQLNSGVAMTQNNVSNEQLTTISASIAQLLASGPQFQQSYGPLSQNMREAPSFDNGGPFEKDSALNIQSNENMGTQQYDPTCDSIEVEKHEIINNPPGFIPTSSIQKNIADEKPEITTKIKPSDAVESSNNNKICGREEAKDKSCQVIQMELGGNVADAKENNGEENTKVEEELRENGPSGDEKTENGKKGKETKAFKFALVEFVKESLKPTWKEGQMSKEAYKNIVKKVVEKVTGSMQGANIPQTQEKIQQYLSTSKPKLTKLVQAYVEKFHKDK